jgi:hypothetical protein
MGDRRGGATPPLAREREGGRERGREDGFGGRSGSEVHVDKRKSGGGWEAEAQCRHVRECIAVY